MELELKVGAIHTVAGTGDSGCGAEDIPASAVSLNEPKGVALDGDGNIYIADSENHLIRMIDRTTNIVRTVAGRRGSSGTVLQQPSPPDSASLDRDDPFAEEAAPGEKDFAQQTDLSGTVRYVVNGTGHAKRFGGDGGPAVQALLNFPSAVAVDRRGHLYIADTMNHRIRRVEAGTGTITTIAGLGQPRYGGDGGPSISAGLNEPAALVVSESGALFVADQSNNRIRAIDLASGRIRTIAGTGDAGYNGDGVPAVEASLAGPGGLAMGSDGTLYIADTFNGRIRAIDPATGIIRTIAGDGGEYRYQGGGEPPSRSLSRPGGIAVDLHGNLFITDSDNHLIRRWDKVSGRLDRLAGVGVADFGGDGLAALDASLSYPFDVAISGDRYLFVADTFNHRIRGIVL
jgi:DNA-binding beta-propeller fold protein YncE